MKQLGDILLEDEFVTPELPSSAPRGAWVPTVLVAAAGVWWATYLTWGSGGREPHRLSVGLVLLLAALLVVRPWRRVPAQETALVLAVPVGAAVVVATAPTGWAGANEAATYLYASLLYLLVRGWATTAERRWATVGLLLAAGGMEFAQGWLPWWGGSDPARPFQGTFYWHNQAGIFLTLSAVIALGCVVYATGALRTMGWFVAPLCIAGAMFTGSRGSQMGLVLGALVLGALSARGGGGRSRLVRLALSTASGVVVATLLTRPPFFAVAHAPTDATTGRTEPLVANGVQRFEDWRRSWEIFKHWPISGAGFHSFDSATEAVTVKQDGVSTAFAHNGFLQAVSDGGLVLALPLLVGLALVGLSVIRRLPVLVGLGDGVTLTAAAALLVALLHSGMDFDWSYPSLFALTAILAALTRPVNERLDPPPPRAWGLATSLLVTVLVGVGVVGAWDGILDLNVPLGGGG